MDDELLSLADVYALDAVDPAERADIDRRLMAADDATRAEFDARVADIRETAAGMTAADAVAPPTSLRASVLGAVAGASEAPREFATRRESGRRRAGPRGHGRTGSDNVVPFRRRTLAVIAGVAAAVIIAAGGIGIGYGIGRTHHQQPSDLQAEVLNAPDATLKTAKLPGGGSTTLVTSADENAAVVLLHRAGAPPKNKVYQMWLMDSHGKHPRSVAVMNRDEVKPTTTALIKGVQNAGAFAITVEPNGGSKQPTGKPFSLISLGQS